MQIIDKFSLILILMLFLGGCASPAPNLQKTSDLGEIKLLIESDPSRINEKDEGGNSLLHIAVRKKDIKLVQYLVSKGADVNIRNNNNDTPLQIAVFFENVEILTLLVSNGANLNVTDFLGRTPLHDTVNREHFQNTKYLISKGAEINTQDVRSKSPLHDAVLDGNIKISEYLILKDANVNAKDEDGKAPLHIASSEGYTEIARHLLTHGADINARDKLENIPLHYAALSGHLEMVKYLVSRGANVNARGAFYLTWGAMDITLGCTPLHIAAHRGHFEIAKYLIAQGADINAKNSRDETPIMFAQRKEHAELAALLASSEKQVKLSKSIVKPETAKVEKLKSEAAKKSSSNLYSLADFGRYHALVIGSNNYTYLPKLMTARNDAKEVADILKNKYGFEVELLFDTNRSDVLLSLSALRYKLTDQDNLLIYYAGHGWLDREADEGYWLPVDAEQDNMINWISNSSITATLRAIRAKHVLIVADSCYSGKLARGIHVVKRTPGYFSRLSKRKARCVISSGGLEPVIDSDGESIHSVFASAFIRALKENNEILDGAQLFNQIRRPVMLNSDQTPEYSDIRKAGHEGGEFIFVPLK